MNWRLVFGVMTFAGAILLAWDLLTIGACESREELVIQEQ
jgi:nitric oxide reductase subunit B